MSTTESDAILKKMLYMIVGFVDKNIYDLKYDMIRESCWNTGALVLRLVSLLLLKLVFLCLIGTLQDRHISN